MTTQFCGVSGSNLGSITPALLEIASTQMEVNNNYNEIAMDSTELQQKFNEAQTDDTRKEGQKGAAICYAQAAGSLASAGCDLGTMAASYASTRSLNSQLETQTGELNELESMQKNVQQQLMQKPNIEAGETVNVNSPPAEEQLKNQESNPPSDSYVDIRTKEMQAGRLLTSDCQYPLKEGEAPLTDQAIAAASTGELNDIKEQTDGQIKNKTQSINTLQNQIQSKEGMMRMFGDMGKQVLNSGSQFAQAAFTAQKSEAQAAGLSAQFDQQIQATAAQTEQKAVGDGVQQVFSVFQALAQAGQAMV